MIKNYFKIAFRSFARHKVFTLINVIGLSVGISAALAIYLIVHFDLSFDRSHPDGDRIYRVVTNFTFSGNPGFNGGVTGPLGDAVKNEVTGLKASAPFYTDGGYKVTIKQEGNNVSNFKNQAGIVYLDERFFSIFPYQWLAGAPKNALDGPHKLVLASKQAKKYFPGLRYDQMLGRTVAYEDTIKAVVTGIIKEPEENTDFTFNDFISLSTTKTISNIDQQQKEWGSTNGSSQLWVKLAKGTSPKSVEKQMDALLTKYNPPKPGEYNSKQWFVLQPISDLHFNEKYYAYDNTVVNKTTLNCLMAVAALLLILGCINFINLTTAQGAQRAKEIGIRKTMGGNRKQLVLQFLSETFLVTVFAVVIAICFLPFVLKLFADFIPSGVTANVLSEPWLIGFLVLVVVTVSALSGFYPAIVLSGYKPVSVLKNQSVNSKSKTRSAVLRKSLTVTQFIVAQFFIIATLAVNKQIYYATHKDLGYKKDAILYLNTPWKVQDPNLKQVLYNKIKTLPQVAMISLGNAAPATDGWSSRDITYKDGKKEITSQVFLKKGDHNYLPLYHIKLLAGRNVTAADTNHAILINDTYARILGFTDPQKAIGIQIPFRQKNYAQVVGVMADFHQNSLRTPIQPMMFLTESPKNFGVIHIALKPETPGGGEWSKAIAHIGQTWKELYPNDDFEYHFFDESIAKFYEAEQRTSTLLTWAMGLSIFISCLGLLGLAIYTTSLRTKEIGVRKVLGASISQIVALLSKETILLIVLAFAIVCPAAWWGMGKWMESYADKTSLSWWIFALSAAGMLLTALITSGFQTIRAAAANPVKSLRSE